MSAERRPERQAGPLRMVLKSTAVTFSVVFLLASIAVPILLLLGSSDKTQERWSNIGQAMGIVGTLYSGIAFLGVGITFFLQRRQLTHQKEQIKLALDEQRRSSEISLRQLHVDLIKMEIDDPELEEVWPPLVPGVAETRKDHYCNLILNLQKVAYDAGTIQEPELRGMAQYLMTSPDIYEFWTKARSTRVQITGGDTEEDFLTMVMYEACYLGWKGAIHGSQTLRQCCRRRRQRGRSRPSHPTPRQRPLGAARRRPRAR